LPSARPAARLRPHGLSFGRNRAPRRLGPGRVDARGLHHLRATLADGGFLLPGLVDVHTHPGSPSEDEPDFEADAFATQVGRQGSFAPAAPSRPDPEGCRPQTPAFGLSGLVLKRRTG